MADDSQMMKDLGALADAHQEAKPNVAPGKIATGPGSGPQRSRRQMSQTPVMVAPRPRRIPDPPSFTRIWGWALAGLALLLLGLLALTPTFFPPSWQKVPHLGRSLAAFLLGLGFLVVGQSRGLSRRSYEIARMKDRKDPHGWKIPLLAAQGLILYGLGIYLLGIVFHAWHSIHNQVGMTVCFLLFLAYALWYLLAYIVQRIPGHASHILAIASSGLATLCFLFWLSQSILISVVFGFFALFCGLTSVQTAGEETSPSRFWFLFIALTAILILPAAINILPFGPKTELLRDLAPTYQGLGGATSALTYSPDGRTLGMAQQVGNNWNLVLVQGGENASPALTVPAGDDLFRPVFVSAGRDLVCDFTVGTARNLYLVDSVSGRTSPLTREGVETVGDGAPWSEDSGRFLYSTQVDGQFEVRSVSPDQPLKYDILLRDGKPLRSLSWMDNGKMIAWIGGSVEDPYVATMNLADRKTHILVRAHESVEDNTTFTPEGVKALADISGRLEKAAGGKVKLDLAPKAPAMAHMTFVLPAPDNFRLLYGITRGKQSEIWAVMPDGSLAKRVYKTDGEISRLSWTPDGQQVVFEELEPGMRHFFLGHVPNVQILDVNVGTHRTLTLPLVAQRSPAISPDGFKVAFLSSPGLWYPDLSIHRTSGLWVAARR